MLPATRAGYPGYPSGTAAGVGDSERPDRLTATCSKGTDARADRLTNPDLAPSLADMERLWSQLAPRRDAGEIAAVTVNAVRSRPGRPTGASGNSG